MTPIALTWEDIYDRVARLPSGRLWGVPRGGSIVAGLSRRAAATPYAADIIVDDIIDSGATKARYEEAFPDKPFVALVDKQGAERGWGWVRFPWEGQDDGQDAAENVRRLLQAIGEDPLREGLRDTPRRVIQSLREMTAGNQDDPGRLLSVTFDAAAYDEMIILRDIQFSSLCEHHLLPFMGAAHVAYIPIKRVVGLSKLARLVECFARRLQIQEKLTRQIADAIQQHLEPRGVGVVIEARHLCMSCRGVRKQDASMTTSALLGNFREHPVRDEFVNLLRGDHCAI